MESYRSQLWLVPAWLAAAAAVQALSTFRSVVLVIRSLEKLAGFGGGVAAVSAGLWEALLPLVAGGYIGMALTLIALVVVIRNIGAASDPEEEWAGKHVALSCVVALFSLAAIVTTTILFRRVRGLILLCVLTLGALIAGVASLHAERARLQHTAMTGEVQQ